MREVVLNHGEVMAQAVNMLSASIPHTDIDVFGDEFLADPYAHHEGLREAGPLFYLSKYQIYGMARHAEVSAALKDWSVFISSRGVGLSDFAKEKPWRLPSLLLEADPPDHRAMRSLMNEVVSPNVLRKIRPLWQAEADNLIDELIAKGRVDGVADLAQVYPLRVFPRTIGLPEEGRNHLLTYAMAVFNAFGPRNQIFKDTDASAGPSTAWVTQACQRANLKPVGWGADVYAAADAGLCSEEDAARLVRSFLTAGVDTTINGIGNMLLAFATHPEQWQKLRENPALLKRAFDEALRWDSTVQTFFRTTSETVAIDGAQIPSGSKVLLFLGAANRDPRRWAEPERFDIERVASGHVGFGFGIHQCLGQMVARLEAEAVLTAMLPRVRRIELTGEPGRILNNTLHALGSLPIELIAA